MRLTLLTLIALLSACETIKPPRTFILADGTETTCTHIHTEACGVILKDCDHNQSFFCEIEVMEIQK